jgi:Ni/Co efflux regulator RcnB
MRRAALIGTLVVSLVTGSAALADGHGHGRDYDRGGRDNDRERSWSQHGDRRDYDRRDYDRRDNDRRDYGRHDYDHRDFRAYAYSRDGYRSPERYGGYGYDSYDSYSRPRGYFAHRWSRGERLPFAYYERPYVIDDYYDYGLYAPPRGHHWVRVDGDAVLAAVATGIVLDSVFHHFH